VIQFLPAVSEKLRCVVYGLDSNGDILHMWTPKNLLLPLPPSQLIGTNVRKWLIAKDADMVIATIRSAIIKMIPVCIRYRIRTGAVVEYHCGRIIPKADGNAAIVFDITETALSA
jgi:hypothetical protein